MDDSDVAFFEDDEDGYLEWSRTHRDGFMINALRGSLDDPVLHRADCRTITEQTGDHEDWTHHYVKVCADELGALRMWAYSQFGTASRECQICSPAAS